MIIGLLRVLFVEQVALFTTIALFLKPLMLKISRGYFNAETINK